MSSPGIFERNPVKTIMATLLVLVVALDFTAERLIDRNDLFNKTFGLINPDLAHKVQIWQHRKQNKYYHHDLEPNHDFIEKWGNLEYRLTTNSLGFKDSSRRTIQAQTDKKRIVFIGDSFTEGLGVPYDKTFVGLINSTVDHEKYEILNAGVVSYSPKLYYYKIKYLLENKHLKIDELFVFIDLSDIFNELEYEVFEAEDPHWKSNKSASVEKMTDFLKHNSLLFNIYRYYAHQSQHVKKLKSLDFIEQHTADSAFWTLNERVYQEWGEKGVGLAELYMQKLVDLCKANNIKITIAVYPWINEIVRGNVNSRQVRIWREFSDLNSINFINYYPDFFNTSLPNINNSEKTPFQIVNHYFITGDIHWNENGHRLIANKIHIP